MLLSQIHIYASILYSLINIHTHVYTWYTYICIYFFKWFVEGDLTLFHVWRSSAFLHMHLLNTFLNNPRLGTKNACYSVTASLLPVVLWQGCCCNTARKRTGAPAPLRALSPAPREQERRPREGESPPQHRALGCSGSITDAHEHRRGTLYFPHAQNNRVW